MNVERGMVYPKTGLAEAWDGLISVDEKPIGVNELIRRREGHAFLDQRPQKFSATVSCYTCPSRILEPKSMFGFSYREQAHNECKIHLVYNAVALKSDQRFYQDDDEPFDLNISTTPIPMPLGLKPSSHIIIDADSTPMWIMYALESIMYGAHGTDPRLPHPDEIFSLYAARF